jgi:hypothetical protein
MVKFYKDPSGNWHIGDKLIPSGTCWIDYDIVTDIKIVSLYDQNDIKFQGPFSELADKDGVAFSDVATMLSTNSDFFVDADVAAITNHEALEGLQGGATSDHQHLTTLQVGLVNNAVQKTGNETINGVKTFVTSPVVPTPDEDMEAATKKYVDDKVIYKALAPVVVNGTTESTLFSPTYKGIGRLIPANTLKVGDVIVFKNNGFFTTATGGTSAFRVKFGNLTLFTQNVTYANNRTNYYIELELITTIRSIGSTGVLISQGRAMIQSSISYGVEVNPLVTLVPITIDTTIDNLLDLTFQWGSAGQSITVSNTIIELK